MDSPSVLASGALTSESKSPSLSTAPSLPSKTTRKRPAGSASGSRKRASSEMLWDSMDDPSTASWIASLRAGRANRTALPESARAPQTNGGSGEILPESPANAGRPYSLARTSAGYSGTPIALLTPDRTNWMSPQRTLLGEWEPFCGIWPKWGFCAGGEVYELPTWAPAMGGRGCSYSESSQKQACSWSTPSACADTHRECIETKKARGSGGINLYEQAESVWSPPDAPKAGGARTHTGSAGKGHQVTIAEQAQAWAWRTPRAEDSESTGAHRGNLDTLNSATKDWQASSWMTPSVPNGGRKMSAADVTAKGATAKGKRQVGLENQTEIWKASAWPTPANRDHRDPNALSYQERSQSTKGEQLNNFVAHVWRTPHGLQLLPGGHGGGGEFAEQATTWTPSDSLPPAPPIRYGLTFSQRVRILLPLCRQLRRLLPSPYRRAGSIFKRKLNPDFVDWLMGWPAGWSSAGRVFSAEEMESYLCRQRALLSCLLGGLD
jgi:hypothetical protein